MSEEKSRHQVRAEEKQQKSVAVDSHAEKIKREDAALRVAAAQIAATPAGKVLFTYLFNLCGYNRSSIASDPLTRETQPGATNHNEAMRLVYIKLRAKLPPDLRAAIENAAENVLEDGK